MNSHSFLSLVAQDLFTRKKGDLKNLVVVFPNRRAGWTFRQELLKLVTKPVWAPEIYSIDDWLIRLSGLHESDSLTQLAALFDAYRKHDPQALSFSAFLDLGEILLRDFEDIDKYLVDARTIFRAVGEFKSFELLFGDPEGDELRNRMEMFIKAFGKEPSAYQKKWLDIWNRLPEIYSDFHKLLESRSLATSGMMYRRAASLIKSGQLNPFNQETVVFAGFNILTRAEEFVFQELRNQGAAIFYWDYHSFYLGKYHEAGRFIRKYAEEFPAPLSFSPFPEGSGSFFEPDSQNQLNILPVTSNTGQVQFVVNQKWAGEPGRHLIVLSDENLMPDLASAWTTDMGSVNFTAGYPLSASKPASFLRSFLKVWNESDQNSGAEPVGESTLQDLFRHSLFQILPEVIRGSFLKWLSGEKKMPSEWIARSNVMISSLLNSGGVAEDLDRAALRLILEESERIPERVARLGLDIDGKGLRHLISAFLSSGKILLEGDFKASVLVAGILETRLLDFDSVTILSFNEGVWPSASLPGSLVPYSLRKYFGLPTAENRDAMYAYYFYRLIQRAASVNLVYLTGQMDNGIRVGEKSRYIRQLEFESDIVISHGREIPVKVVSESRTITIEKNPAVMESLYQFFNPEKGRSLSASALNDYLDCPLRFCLAQVYGLRQPIEEEQPSDPKGFGKLIHNGLEALYIPFLDGTRQLNSASLQHLIDNEGKTLTSAHDAVSTGGKDDVALLVAKEFILSVLKHDLEAPPDRIMGLERTVKVPFGMRECGFESDLQLKAVIDRFDVQGGQSRVVDYKTGKCELSFTGLDDLFDATRSQRKKEIFQVLFYSELLLLAGLADTDVIPSLYPLISMRAGKSDTRVKLKTEPLFYSDIREAFRERLGLLVAEIFDPSIPFTQTSDEYKCRMCPFAGICMRD